MPAAIETNQKTEKRGDGPVTAAPSNCPADATGGSGDDGAPFEEASKVACQFHRCAIALLRLFGQALVAPKRCFQTPLRARASRPERLHENFANELALRRFAWVFGGGLLVALAFPQVLFAATISSFTGFAAGVVATMALFARDPLWVAYLTRWDVAAALYAASLFTGFFVDIDAVQLFLIEQRAGGY